jgi:hypothetical protein
VDAKNPPTKENRKMQKIICKKTYDTETSTLLKKVTFGAYGSPEGWEESLYQTESGNFFLYTNGGANSKHTKEDITRMSAEKKNAWLKANA